MKNKVKFAPKEALDLEFYCRDLSKKLTIRAYLRALLERLFEEEDGFSGKRPFGNSCWSTDLAVPLIDGGMLSGTVEDGCAEGYDMGSYWQCVFAMIEAL